MLEEINTKNNLNHRIALLKVVACFMVILLHVSAELFVNWNEKWWAGNFYDSLVRCCIPIFLMIGGATLLPKQETLSVFFKKRFTRIIPPLLLWSVFYLWWLEHNGVDTGNWAIAILKGPTMYHLWYFYALVGLYFFVPVFRKFYQNSSRQEQLWFILVWLAISSILPTAQNLLFNFHCEGGMFYEKLSTTYHFSYFGGYIGYLMLGAYAAQSKPNAKLGWFIFSMSSLATMIGSYLISDHFGRSCEFLFVYLSPFIVAASYGLFIAFMSMNIGSESKLLFTIADCTLGIYGIHVFVIGPVFLTKGISVTLGNPWLSTPAVALGVFLVSFMVIFMLRLVKPLRYFF